MALSNNPWRAQTIINHTASFAWEWGQHTGCRVECSACSHDRSPSIICSCVSSSETTKFNTPNNQGWILRREGQFCLRSFMLDELLWLEKNVWHSWHWMSWSQTHMGQQKRSVVLSEASTCLPETACSTVSPDLSSFHFLDLDENKARKQKWLIFHPPAPELQKPSVVWLPPGIHRA